MDGASQTAIFAAQVRAAHGLLDPDPIFRDQYALALAGVSAAEVADLFAAIPGGCANVARVLPSQRARFVDEEVERAVHRGVDQYVVLGAGLDSFAWRRSDLTTRLDVYEVDHPATQEWKRARVDDAGLGWPPRLHAAAVDFALGDGFAQPLVDAGFDPTRPSIWSWLGVVVYLPLEAVGAGLRSVGSLAAPGSRLITSYTVPRELMDADALEFDDLARAASAADGEPHVTFLTPDAMEALARAAGWPSVESIDPLSFAPWFEHRRDGLRPVSYEWILVADA